MELDFGNFEKFVTLDRVRLGGSTGLYQCIRVRSTGVALSSDIMERFQITEEDEQVTIVLQYSEEHKALRLLKPQELGEGFVFSRKNGKTGFTSMPAAFKRLNIPRGTYTPAGEQYPDIYVFNDNPGGDEEEGPEEKYFIEEPPTTGDIVSWRPDVKPKDGGTGYTTTMTGVVGAIFQKQLNDGTQEDWASVKPISKTWSDAYPDRQTVNVKLTNLIVRERSNA